MKKGFLIDLLIQKYLTYLLLIKRNYLLWNVHDEAIRNTDSGKNSFRSLSSSSTFNQFITASEEDLMNGYFQYRFGDDYIDSPQYYDSLTPEILTQINNVYRK